MAVATADLALRDLLQQPLQAASAPGEGGYGGPLCTNMVELKEYQAPFAAVHTAGTRQEVAHVDHVAPLAGNQVWIGLKPLGIQPR